MTSIGDTTGPGTARGPLIDISEIFELNLWCKKLGATPFELKEAVRKVGSAVNDVQDYLNRRKG